MDYRLVIEVLRCVHLRFLGQSVSNLQRFNDRRILLPLFHQIPIQYICMEIPLNALLFSSSNSLFTSCHVSCTECFRLFLKLSIFKSLNFRLYCPTWLIIFIHVLSYRCMDGYRDYLGHTLSMSYLPAYLHMCRSAEVLVSGVACYRLSQTRCLN